MLPAVKKAQFTVDENAVNSVAGGFFFDASSVQTEYSNVQTEMEAVITPIIMGVISYEDGLRIRSEAAEGRRSGHRGG